MLDSLTDRTETYLRHARRATIPLSELAEQLRADPGSLARLLDHDNRFLLLRPDTAPDLSLLPSVDRDAYAAAFRAAGIHFLPAVALADPPAADPRGPLEILLQSTVARLLASRPEPALAAATDRVRAALEAAAPTARRAHGTDPSTTPLPDRSGPARVPPRRRMPSPPRPPYPGSRPG